MEFVELIYSSLRAAQPTEQGTFELKKMDRLIYVQVLKMAHFFDSKPLG